MGSLDIGPSTMSPERAVVTGWAGFLDERFVPITTGSGVTVGGTGVAVGGTGVAVGGIDVAVGGTGVAVGRTGVGVGVGVGAGAAPQLGGKSAALLLVRRVWFDPSASIT